jgi:DNA-binding transcriptional MerR regulator
MMERVGEKLLKIGEVARLTGFSVKTLHYYEERGLIEPAERSDAGYRLYGREEVARLEFIKKAKLLGLTLKEVAELVDLAAEGSQGRVIPRLEQVLENHLEETERKMAELAGLQESLIYYRERLFEADPVESCGCGEGVSFCGCLEAVTGERASH